MKLPEWWPHEKSYAFMDCIVGMKELPDGCIDLIPTDPPYGITNNKWDILPDWDMLSLIFDRLLVWNGQIAIFGKQPMITNVFNSFNKLFDFRFDLVWYKGVGMWSTNYAPIPVHEHILVFKKRGCKVSEVIFNLDEIKTIGKPYTKKRYGAVMSTNQAFKGDYITENKGFRHPKSVIEEFAIRPGSKEYVGFPTQKPIRVMEWLVRALSPKGGIALDPFLGSGTTLRACRGTGRIGLGFETNEQNEKMIHEKSLICHKSLLEHLK